MVMAAPEVLPAADDPEAEPDADVDVDELLEQAARAVVAAASAAARMSFDCLIAISEGYLSCQQAGQRTRRCRVC
jgi:hypothetical protein